MNKKLVIFGASGGGIKVAQTLQSFGIDFECFLDNNLSKWGTALLDKQICSPQILLEDNYQIIIASEYQAEIEKQLEEMGQLSHLILKEDLILPEIEKLLPKIKNKFGDWIENESRTIIIDLLEGVQLGGIETWTCRVARELQRQKENVLIYAVQTQMQPEEDIAGLFQYYELSYLNFKENVVLLARQLIRQLPCGVIINKHTQLLYAAHLVKEIVGDKIQIISVLHSDSIVLYRRQKRIDDITDKVMCVSVKIKNTLIREFGVRAEKVFYKESPVYVSRDLQRGYLLDKNKPLKIGYVGRLVKLAKRADLLLELIKQLEERQINYEIEIAGDGSYRKNLEEYVEKNGLEQKVKIVGRIDSNDIPKFWRNQDIFVNVSDFEGVGLSMLEAMAEGVVPIETNVAGAEEFIQNNQNGFVVDIGDIKKMVEYISYMEKNRELVSVMGKRSYRLVKIKCSVHDYANYLLNLCK